MSLLQDELSKKDKSLKEIVEAVDENSKIFLTL